MFVRNLLLGLGALCLLGGIVLSIVWYRETPSGSAETHAPPRPAVIVATRTIPPGTLLRPDDISWQDIAADQIRPGSLTRGQATPGELVGALTRRKIEQGDALLAADLIRPSERQFLSAVLKAGMRAVSIAVDAPQSASGLVLPGDQVDVILTQSFGDANNTDLASRSVAETILRDIRVIAIDQTLGPTDRTPAAANRPILSADARVPKTVTFEVSSRDAERLVLASQLGRLQLSVRPLEVEAAARSDGRAMPVWASDLSAAVNDLARRRGQAASPVEAAVRRPPLELQ